MSAFLTGDILADGKCNGMESFSDTEAHRDKLPMFQSKIGRDGQLWIGREECEPRWVVEANALTSPSNPAVASSFLLLFHCFHWQQGLAQLLMHYKLHNDNKKNISSNMKKGNYRNL